MLLKFKPAVAIATLLLGVMSCSERIKNEEDPNAKKVIVSTKLTAESSMNFPSSGDDVDLSQIPVPAVGDFVIDITREGQPVAKYQYSERPANQQLAVGKYNIKATYGTQIGADWNTVFYDGTQDFVLSHSQTEANVALECQLQTAFAFARFDSKFRDVFRDISVKFVTDQTPDGLVFNDGETRIACFAPAKELYVLVSVTMKAGGKKYTYGIDPLQGLVAGDLNVFNFTVQDGQMLFDLTTDNTVAVKSQTVALDPDWLAKRGTRMTTSYDETTPIQHLYGLPYNNPLDIVIGSNADIASIYVKFDAALAAELGKDSINVLNMTPQEQELIDSRVGVVCTSAGGRMNYRVNLKECLNKMELRGSADTDHKLTISATNTLGHYCQRELSMTIKALEFRRAGQDASKVWNRYAYIPSLEVTNIPALDNNKVTVEYWVSEDQVNWRSVAVSKPSSGAVDIYINGLKPATTYYSRASVKSQYTASSSFTTDTETQIPNGNFEQYWSRPYSGNNNPFYELYAEGDPAPWWATTNPATTYNRGTSYTNYAQSYASVQVVDGNGGKAVQITTVGWGDNSKIEHANPILGGGHQYRDAKQYASAGKVFIGSYNYTGSATAPSGDENHGQAFDQKPLKVKFKYKFENYKSGAWEMRLHILSGSDEMASVIYPSSATQPIFTELELPVVYHSTFINSTPTQIKLSFTSQNTTPNKDSDITRVEGSDKPGGGLFNPSWKPTKDSYFIGNTLTIDDIELIYPQDITDQYTVQ